DFISIISYISYEAVQSESATKMQHRTNFRPPVGYPRDPACRDPETDSGNKGLSDGHGYKRPISVANSGTTNSNSNSGYQGDDVDHGKDCKTHLALEKGRMLYSR